jgi:hypothetical protein
VCYPCSFLFTLYRVIKKSLCTWWFQHKKHEKIPTQLLIWRCPTQNTFRMWTMLYWTWSLRTQFGVSVNVWKLLGDTLNITTCNFLHCNHQVHGDFLIALYIYCTVSGQVYLNPFYFPNFINTSMVTCELSRQEQCCMWCSSFNCCWGEAWQVLKFC